MIPKIPRVEESCDVEEEEEEMQGVSESDLEEEERRGRWLARILLFLHSLVCIFACSLRVVLYNDTMI